MPGGASSISSASDVATADSPRTSSVSAHPGTSYSSQAAVTAEQASPVALLSSNHPAASSSSSSTNPVAETSFIILPPTPSVASEAPVEEKESFHVSALTNLSSPSASPEAPVDVECGRVVSVSSPPSTSCEVPVVAESLRGSSCIRQPTTVVSFQDSESQQASSLADLPDASSPQGVVEADADSPGTPSDTTTAILGVSCGDASAGVGGGSGGGGGGGVVQEDRVQDVVLMQTVLMETSYGPINGPAGVFPMADPDLLDNGKSPASNIEGGLRRPSQDSFTEYVARASTTRQRTHAYNRRADKNISKRMRRRLVYKNGEVNITQTNIRKRRRRYLADIFTTLVDIKWRYNLMLFAMAFIVSWLIFALIWWLVCFSHGDLDHIEDDNWTPCVENINSFTSALLFSIETQHTIGYGSRHTTEECPEAIVLMMFQSCFGVICQALMTGIVFAKLSRPKKRAETLMFSKSACICKQDGDMCLLFRVGDMRKSQIVEAHIRGVLIKKKVTKEGDVLPLYQFDVDVGFDDGRDRLFLVWPVIIVHKINQNSPFWEMSLEDLHREQFELIVVLEGIVESTGMTTQARSSYLPGEVLWGHRFERLVTFQKENGQYQIDFSRFHNTVPVDTPSCSAKDFSEVMASGRGPDSSAFIDDDENASIASKSERFPNPYVVKRHGVAQTDFDDDDDDFDSLRSKQSTSTDLGSRAESETFL